MKKLLCIFITLFFVSCSPKLFTTYKNNDKKLEKINLVKLNEYLGKKRLPGFEKSSRWSNIDNSTGSYIFTSKNGKTTISITKKDGEFTFLKKIIELETKVIVNEYRSSGILEKSDTILKSEIKKRPQIDVTIKNPALNFTYKNSRGDETSLSEFLGKYVYINVWASWSVPSQSEILALNKIINEFKNKNITFINLAMDSEIDFHQWKKIIEAKKLNGVQLFCGEGWDCEFVENYKVYYIPRAILINPKGKVINAFAPRPSNIRLEKTLDSIFLSKKSLSQVIKKPNIIIDTVQFNFKLKSIANITSFVPQIKSGINSVAQKRINKDLKTYFQATSIEQDSATYVKKLLSDFDVENLKDYFEIIEEQKQFNPNYRLSNPYYHGNELEESFNIEYLSQTLLNVTISTQILPYRGQYQFFFKSAFYDLRTGNKLEFNDFFAIPSDSLVKMFNSRGYEFGWDNETLNTTKHRIDNELIRIDNSNCRVLYFKVVDSKIYLMMKALCIGPQLVDYGIPINELKPYIEYSEFKNILNLWGKDIYSLIGYDYVKVGREIQFKDYRIDFVGAYLLPNDEKTKSEFAIATYKSAQKRFYLLLKTIDNKRIIIDILEIKTTEFENLKIVEYCQMEKEIELGIIAVVKNKRESQKFYYEILKAWRANQKTGKFETIKKNKIKKCQNESN